MDNIKFLGYFSDGTLKKACKQCKNPTSLDTFYNAVQPVELPIKSAVLSLCVECLSSLPLAL